MKRKASAGWSVLEMMVVMIFIGILVSVAITRFMQGSIKAKEALLRSELTNVRLSIALYELINGKFPESLAELEEKEYMKSYSDGKTKINVDGEYVENTVVIKGDYLKATAVDSSGTPLDPFGMKYSYNKDNGKIKCLTKGYEGW